MTEKIKAIGRLRPRVIPGQTVQSDELVRYMSQRTGLNSGEIALVLHELSDAVVFFNLAGRAVRLDRLGTYFPAIRLNGQLKAGHRLAPFIRKTLNNPGQFTGQIANKHNIGKTVEELVDLWDQENPEDPVE